jgi:hypothetical protein
MKKKKKIEQWYLLINDNDTAHEFVVESELNNRLKYMFEEEYYDCVESFINELAVYKVEKMKVTVKQQKTEIRVG